MKKLLLLVALAFAPALVTTTTEAQTVKFNNAANTDGRADTISTATTTYFYASTNTPANLGIGINCAKVSGTISATAYLEASCDPNSITGTYVTLDSLVLANQANNNMLKAYTPNVYPRYRWRIVSATGTFIVRPFFNK